MLLFHLKTIVKDTHSFELTDLKQEEDFGHFVTFWFGTFTVFFHTTRSRVGHENTQR